MRPTTETAMTLECITGLSDHSVSEVQKCVITSAPLVCRCI
ncbi:hypothetical protein HMPREF1587_00183 [Bifidobacterium breve JCP7499]|nr:hypothetical protein HMPREF1587_00183 [Bifidobacterium breve JCP7499]